MSLSFPSVHPHPGTSVPTATITVFHAPLWMLLDRLLGDLDRIDPGSLLLVSRLATGNLDLAWAWTQHGAIPWDALRSHVIAGIAVPQPRSSMVGDVFRQDATGACFVVAPTGFQRLPDPLCQAINQQFPVSAGNYSAEKEESR
jgi:hypothetical protein